LSSRVRPDANSVFIERSVGKGYGVDEEPAGSRHGFQARSSAPCEPSSSRSSVSALKNPRSPHDESVDGFRGKRLRSVNTPWRPLPWTSAWRLLAIDHPVGDVARASRLPASELPPIARNSASRVRSAREVRWKRRSPRPVVIARSFRSEAAVHSRARRAVIRRNFAPAPSFRTEYPQPRGLHNRGR